MNVGQLTGSQNSIELLGPNILSANNYVMIDYKDTYLNGVGCCIDRRKKCASLIESIFIVEFKITTFIII